MQTISIYSLIAMRKTFFLIPLLYLFVLFVYISCQTSVQERETDYAQYVDPFIGGAANGHTFPGACRPFGMIQTSPVTGALGWEYCSEYTFQDSIIWGFTQTHLNGTGCTDLGDILLMPVTDQRHRAWDGYRSLFDKKTEAASPGYYTVELSEPQVKAELTASTHVAMHRYTYHKADSASLLIDFQHGPAWNAPIYHSQVEICDVEWKDEQTLIGHVMNTVWVKQHYFFVMKFNRPIINSFDLPLDKEKGEKGRRIVATFNMNDGDELLVKVALSTTSVEGAQKNLIAEVPDWDFEKLRQSARADWNSYLSRIEVEGSKEEKTTFYTCFYHTLIQPNQISDVDGKYRDGIDSIITASAGTFYSTFSLWDTYRAAHPFYTLIVPDKVDAFVSSLVEQGEVQGFLPIWPVWGRETYCMIGNHAVSVIAEAYRKGFRGFDAERAYHMVMLTQRLAHPNKSYWHIYNQYGYYPTDQVKLESVSLTLESAYDFYAAADMARRLGKTEDAEYFAERAGYYKNLFDPSTNFMRPRLADSTWKSPFNPSQVAHAESVGGDYTEGNAWQYTWHVQHDVPGLINLFGGEEAFLAKLDSVFTMQLVTTQSDVTGLIGQYAHGNEPSHHIAYLYALAGKPERTQELVRQICRTQYYNRPDGLCGNDDCGQMSAWYMFSSMGFYPVNPVSGEYVFGAPQLPHMILHLNNGKQLEIIAKDLSDENMYVESITLNGKPYEEKTISHETLLQGGQLVYQMRK